MSQMLIPSNGKIRPTLLANLSTGAIVGLTKSGRKDEHFIYKNWDMSIDSLDPNRSAARRYTENSYRILCWGNIN